jgi:lipopolysaccharide export system permease protein
MARLLFITSNRIGDAVLSTAVLEWALARLPGAQVDIVAGALALPLFRATPGLRRTYTLEKKEGRWRGLWAQLRRERYDLAIDLRGSLVTLGLDVKMRIIHRKSRRIEHKIVELSRLVKARTQLHPRLRLDEKALADAEAFVVGAPAVLALGPGANFIGKRWPPQRFGDLALQLTAQDGLLPGARIVLLGAPDDRAITGEIYARLHAQGRDVRDGAGVLDLPGGAGVLSRANIFIGNDSGLMHMAAAIGTATLGLFGPSDERVYGPWGPRTMSLRGKAYDEIMAIGYMPHITRTLMEDIAVDAVSAAAKQLLEKAEHGVV